MEPSSHLTAKPSSSKKQLRTSISLNLRSHIGEGLGLDMAQPLSPMNYQFLLRRPSAVIEEQMEEAILAVGSVSSPIGFRDAVMNALYFSLFNVKQSMVFLLHRDTNELVYYITDTSFCPLPKSGVLWDAVRRRAATIVKASNPIRETDPLRKLMKDFKPLEGEQVVLINPIVRKKDNEVIALITVVCTEPSVAQVEKLRWLERNVLVAAARVLNYVTIEKNRMRAEDMLDVCSDLIDLDTTSLSIKILKHIKSTLDVKMCFLFLISESTQELVCPAQNDTPLEKEVRMELTSETIYGRCHITGEALLLEDVSQDARFNPAKDKVNGYEPSAMMCLPICIQKAEKATTVPRQHTVGVAVVCDKTNGKVFTWRDQENLEFVLRFSSSVIANTLAFQRELTLKKQNQALLLMAKNLFSQLNNLNTLFSEIMNEARNLTKAERCSLFLLDPDHQELVAAVFDGDLPNNETIKIKVGQGIAGLVAQTGKLVNIKDAYKHPQFFSDMDKNTGFRTKNMLCFPIKDHQGLVVGVAELCNKIGASFFTTYDEELATTFSVYCGISLYQSQLYQKITESQGKHQLATEMMIYHMGVSSSDVDKLAIATIPTCSTFSVNFSDFAFSPRSLAEEDTIMAVLSMMTEMDLLNRWKIQRNTLAKFLLMVKKGYRDPPYHNWYHALSVTHFCYLLHTHCDLFSMLTDMEVLALFISCLCHDIDHRGTNNAFQLCSNSTMASLYSSAGSVMERHHFAQTVCLLNSENCNIFENLSHDHYKQMLDLIRHNILATDLHHHFKIIDDIEAMAEEGYQSSNPQHHKQMCCLVMTSSDLSSASKEWKWSEIISDLIYNEFFTQGDLEKQLGQTPSEMMDRNKAFVPEQQLGFIAQIAGPAYKFLAKLMPNGAQAYQNLLENKKEWERLASEKEKADKEKAEKEKAETEKENSEK